MVNTHFIRMLYNAFIAFALIFFVSRMAFGAPINTKKVDPCVTAYQQAEALRCNQLANLAERLTAYGEVPASGAACQKANRIYDQMSKKYYECEGVGTSEKNSCFSVCRSLGKKEMANHCYEISRDSKKINFENLKAPSCDEASTAKAADYVEPRTVRRIRNDVLQKVEPAGN